MSGAEQVPAGLSNFFLFFYCVPKLNRRDRERERERERKRKKEREREKEKKVM